MGTTSQKLTYLNDTKTKIRNRINSLGGSLDSDDTFRSYADELESLYDEMPKVSESDVESASLSPTRKGAMSITYKGQTQQDSTTGKNLLGLNNLSSTTTNQVTYSVNNQVLSVSGTSNNGFNEQISTASITLQANQPYTIVTIAEGTSSATGTNISILLGNSSKLNIVTCRAVPSETGVNVINRTPTTDESITRVGLYFSGASLTCNMKVKVMVVKGTYTAATVLPYEPYTNGASPNPDYPQPIHNVSGDNTIEICGKNLFDGILEQGEYDSSDGTKKSNSSRYRNANIIKVQPNTTYTTSINGVAQKYVMHYYDESKAFISAGDNTTGTFTTPANCYYINFRCYAADYTSDYANLKVQLEKGETASEYEAYTGQSQLISLGVENLFDKTNYLQGYSYTGSEKSANTNWGIAYIKCNANETFTISGLKAYSNVYIVQTDNNKVFVSNLQKRSGGTQYTITSTQDGYIGITFLWANVADGSELDTMQLEKGSKANSYSPYGASYIELNKISTYQDYIYKDNDRWFLHKEIGKVVFNGSESWTINTSYTYNVFYRTLDNYARISNTQTTYCEYYKGIENTAGIVDFGNNYNNSIGVRTANDNIKDIYISNNSITSATDFKTWLSTHNTSVYYVLAEPTDTEITDTTLLEQLETIKRSYDSVTNISQENNDLPFILDVSALKEWE